MSALKVCVACGGSFRAGARAIVNGRAAIVCKPCARKGWTFVAAPAACTNCEQGRAEICGPCFRFGVREAKREAAGEGGRLKALAATLKGWIKACEVSKRERDPTLAAHLETRVTALESVLELLEREAKG